MRKDCITIIFFLTFCNSAFCSKYSYIPISTTFSQNKEYAIKSFSYDTEYPTTRGKSIVYKNGKRLYSIPRSFDLYKHERYCLVISTDGTTVAYLTNDVYQKGEEFKNVTIYKKGQLSKAYNLDQFTGCNTNEEKCNLFYDNESLVVDVTKSNIGGKYKKIYKEGVNEEELYLNNNYLSVNNDTIYLVDSRKIVTVYDLNKQEIIGHYNFKNFYNEIKNYKVNESKIDIYECTKCIQDLEDKRSGKTLSSIIESISGLKYNQYCSGYYRYYSLNLTGYLYQNGKFEIETIKCDKELHENEIISYLKTHRFKSDFLSKQLDKQYFNCTIGGFRNPNDSIATEEYEARRTQAIESLKMEYKRNVLLDSINGVYIPRNLEDCFVQIDKILKVYEKENIKNLKDNSEMVKYQLGFGMWLRNNWSLWHGSRISKYFNERGIDDPESMSSIILSYYYDWLKGNKNIASEWENQNSIKK